MAYNPNNPNGQATSANSAPVVIASDQSALPISGTVTANIGTTNGLALDTSVNSLLKPSSTLAAVTAITNAVTVVQATGANLNVAVSNFPATQNVNVTNASLAVTGTFFQATQPISAASLPLPTGASTSALQTSGNALLTTIAANTGAQAADFVSTGTITALNGTVSVTGQGVYTVTASITGTWVGTLVFEGQTADNNWQALSSAILSATPPYALTPSTATNGVFIITGGGFLNIRVRASVFTSGTVNVALDGSLSQQTIYSAQMGTWSISGSSTTLSGTIAGNGNLIASGSLSAYAGAVVALSGTWSSTITVQGSNDGTNYYPVAVNSLASPNLGPQASITTNGLYYIPIGFAYLEVVSSSYVSGTISCVVTLHSVAPALIPPEMADKSTTGTLGALNATVVLPLNSISSAYALISGTWAGTIQFQGSVDGVNYVPLEAVQGGPTNAYTTAGFTSNGGVRIALPAAFVSLRALMSSYTSGTATVVINASVGTANTESIQFNAANLNAQVVGNVASGATDSGNGVKVSAVFNTTLPSIASGQRADNQADTNGRLIVTNAPLDGSKTSYSAAASITLAATATDFFTITGSATKTIRVTRIAMSGTATTATSPIFLIIKRSTANSGGTSASVTPTPHDSNNAAGTATILSYSANPTTLGTAVGSALRATRYTFPLNGGTLTEQVWDFGNRPAQAIVLRGTSQVLALNASASTVVGSALAVYIEWTEE